ncbi:methyltransferase domain-containing protein [Actinosynnema sp. NPDC020468]|uniref:class I SAM-dependent methyltransferase n=1 Tax=Actinosynnema sp. NPDC020468 TaxID=3154488 RepID=UPI0033CF4742
MTEPAFLTEIRAFYDTVAAAYNDSVPPPEGLDPLSRAVLAAFAELVPDGPVADLGCGPGKFTAHLAGLGKDAFGVDLSPNMVEQARATFPDLRFEVGSMLALDLPDGGLAGVLAFYSTHHTPPEHLPTVYGEFHRVLRPGGLLFVGGHVGDHEHVRSEQGYGGPTARQESHLVPVETIADLLRDAGLVVEARVVRETGSRRPYAYFLARKPE